MTVPPTTKLTPTGGGAGLPPVTLALSARFSDLSSSCASESFTSSKRDGTPGSFAVVVTRYRKPRVRGTSVER